MQAAVIILKARKLLQDLGKVRWTDADLLGWLNSAQRQVVAVRPDAKAKKATLTLVAGVEQNLPADGTRLLSVLHNILTVGSAEQPGRVVTLVTRDEMNAINLSWTAAGPAQIQKHYLFDEDTPKSFEVTPPAIAGNKLRIAYAVLPTDCADLTSSIDLDDIYEGPLIDFVCARAFMQDSDDPQDGGRAANHVALAIQALTGKTQSDGASAPKRK